MSEQLSKAHRVNEGAHISGNGISVDVIVREIGGPRKKREADLEIRGVEGMSKLHLKHSDAPVELTEGLKIGIYTSKNRPSTNKVRILYDISGEYQLKYKTYELDPDFD